MKAQKILDDRENLYQEVLNHLKIYQQVIILKANIPGDDKNINLAYILINLFIPVLNQHFNALSYSLKDGNDGPSFLICLNQPDSLMLKKRLMDIEMKHPLGRFVDLDVIDHQKGYISRSYFKEYLRTCMMCENDAISCMKSKKHEVKDILNHIHHKVFTYVKKNLYDAIDLAMSLELDLDPKFGLVTKKSKGSHNDMDYEMMQSVKPILIKGFISMFETAYNQDLSEKLLLKAKEIGMHIEEEMLLKTKGVNCYKGLIYALGWFMLAYADCVKKGKSFHDMFNTIKNLAKNELKAFDHPLNTYGASSFHQFGFLGARGEAYLGYPSVFKAIEAIKTDINDENQIYNLIKIICHEIEDSCLLKRAKTIESYHDAKMKIQKLNIDIKHDIQKLTDEFIMNNLSVGGTADILVVTLWLKMIKKHYAFLSKEHFCNLKG